MRAVVITHPGGPEVLAVREVPVPEPHAGEIRVRVRAFGINRADLLQRRGRYPAPDGVPPDIPGLEFAGLVDARGSGDTVFDIGARVMGIAGGGTYADYVVIPASHTVAIPDNMTDADAAAIPEVFVTAHDALRRADLRSGEWLLIHAVGSGVGLAALQLATAIGARVIGTSRTADKLERARALGLDVAIHASTDDLGSIVRAATDGVGANVVLDLVGGAQLPRTLDVMAEQGRLILVGLTAGISAEVDLALVLQRRLRIEGTVLRSRSTQEKARAVAAFAADVLPLLADGTIRPVVHAVLPFVEVAEAHRLMEFNLTFGKVVVEVP
ncbi:MAG: NAD(P)H-quinone oxidoreductase [Gemmatimonadota bacterium]|nr:NAD(P)H-quinone oxidoreductase [Gemmatimonadota bacterium]